MTKPEQGAIQKWIIADKRRFGPVCDWVVLIPRHHFVDEDYYFRVSEREAVPQSRVFDDPESAALAHVEWNKRAMQHYEVENMRVMEWYEATKAKREKEEAAALKETEAGQ